MIFFFVVVATVVVVVVLLLPAATCTATDDKGAGTKQCHLQLDGSCLQQQQQQQQQQQDGCGLYMAESAIPNSGLGMYTARSIAEHERIFSGDVVLNIEDIEVNLQLQLWYNNNQQFQTIKKPERWLLDQYFWNAVNTLAMHEADDIQSILPGLGMLANSHTGLVNAVLKPPVRVSHHLHRGQDPGTGASTTFHDVHFVAGKGPIEAGSELYVEYGDGWFEERIDLGMIPLSGDFRKADELLEKLERILVETTKMTTNNSKNKSNHTLLAEQVWDLLLHAVSDEPRLKNALPQQLQDVHHVHRIGTANNSVPNRIRSPEWLETNGICIDNIRPGMSTVQQAGQGAFATRNIAKGTIIAPLPMVHMRRHQMEIYDAENIENPDTNVWKVGTQQFLNYCYSHPDSSLLLFPYAPVVNYVNHNSNKTAVNAKLEWSTHTNHHADWLQLTPTELLNTKDHAGIIMEMVATRDIAADEEIFLNYGAGWEQAWKEYVETKWKPDDEDKKYVSAIELDSQIEVLKTKDELETSPYGLGTVLTVCTVGNFDGKVRNEKETTIYEWNSVPNMYNNADHQHPCQVVKREKATGGSDFLYTVSITDDDEPSEREVLVEHVPRSAIQFYDQPYTSDMFLRNSFRHEIWIPDEIFPAAWRDLKS